MGSISCCIGYEPLCFYQMTLSKVIRAQEEVSRYQSLSCHYRCLPHCGGTYPIIAVIIPVAATAIPVAAVHVVAVPLAVVDVLAPPHHPNPGAAVPPTRQAPRWTHGLV